MKSMKTVSIDNRVFLVDVNSVHIEFETYETLCQWYYTFSGSGFPKWFCAETKGYFIDEDYLGWFSSLFLVGNTYNEIRKGEKRTWVPRGRGRRHGLKIETRRMNPVWTICDSKGRTIDANEFRADVQKVDTHYPEYIPRRMRKWTYPGFRNGPWPGTGKRVWRMFRSIHTAPILRDHAAMVADGMNHYVRGKRRSNNIPDSWEDVCRTIHRSWKNKKKKKQWM